MPTIPIPQRPGVIAAPYQGATPADRSAEFAGAEALARGVGRIGQAVGQIGEAIVEFNVRSARIKNEADLTAGRLEMRKAQLDIQNDLANEADPSRWQESAEKRIETASGEIFNSKRGIDMNRVVADQLQQEFRDWAQTNALTVRNQAERKENDNADALFREEQVAAISAGNLDEARAIIGKRWQLGLIPDQQAEIELKQAAHDVDVQQVNRAINTDAHAAIEALKDQTEGGKYRNFTHLSEAERLSALRSAKNARETQRAETAQAFSEEIYEAQNTGRVPTNLERRIDEAVESNRLLPSQANNLKRLLAGQRTPREQAIEASGLWEAALNLDRSNPDWKQQEMQIRAAAAGLEAVVRAPIIEALDFSVADSTDEVVRNAFALLQRDYSERTDRWTATELNALTRRERKALGNPEPGDFKDREQGPEASETLFRHQLALRQFIQKNPQATAADILKERARLSAADRQTDLGQRAIDDLSAAVQ